MQKEIKFPAGYRYDSDIDMFKLSVDYTKEMINNKQLLIVYGFVKDVMVKFLLNENEYLETYKEVEWNDYIEILKVEILPIIEENYNEPLEMDDDLLQYLYEKDIDEKLATEICALKLEKRKYVFEKLFSVQDQNRYELKKNVISNKLSGFAFDVAKTIGDEGIHYANIKIKSDEVLSEIGLPNPLVNLMSSNGLQEVSFVCDKHDIEYLIAELKNIQNML